MLLTASLAAGALAIAAPPALAQNLTEAPPVVVDGPSPDIVGVDGMSIARDGTGGIVYLKDVAGVSHVFVSRLEGGVFQAPEQVDAALPGPSSQPVIAAGNGGLLLIAFINGGSLWVVDRLGSSAPYPPPADLFDGASNPSLQMSNFGKAYLAFTASVPGGDDVRSAYYYTGQWALEPMPLNVVPGDDAGTGDGRPDVAAANDGVAIVVWGEDGHIYARRVWGTSPSVEYEQADVPTLSGWSEVTADNPSVGSEGNSSYADVVFDEVLTNGPDQQERVLMNRLQAAVFDGVTQPDGLGTPGTEGADEPQISDSEYGNGFITSAHDVSNQVWASLLTDNGRIAQTLQVDSLPNATPPYATSGMDGLYSGMIVWQHDPGPPGVPEILARRYDPPSGFGPELVLSSPTLGPTDAAGGIATAGDLSGDAAAVWLQGAGSSTQIVAAQLYRAPGGFAPEKSSRYARTTQPVLSWSTPKEEWALSYQVTVDGVLVGQTTATSLTVPAALTQGPHKWQVTAVNGAGVTSKTKPATVFVDTIPPLVSFKLTGRLRAGSTLHIYVSDTDAPPGVPPADASGVATVKLSWGDGTSYLIKHGKYHVYKRPGHYLVKVKVTDRAGNVTTVERVVKIAHKPVPRRKHRRKRAKS